MKIHLLALTALLIIGASSCRKDGASPSQAQMSSSLSGSARYVADVEDPEYRDGRFVFHDEAHFEKFLLGIDSLQQLSTDFDAAFERTWSHESWRATYLSGLPSSVRDTIFTLPMDTQNHLA